MTKQIHTRPRLDIRDNGSIASWTYVKDNKVAEVAFNQEEGYGPCWYGTWDEKEHYIALSYNPDTQVYETERDGLLFQIRYELQEDRLLIHATLRNLRSLPFQPKNCGLKLGIDTYMATYPEWLNKYFPSYMRCEKTHFTGYLMSPTEDILLLTCPDPIASWSLDYNTHDWGGYKWGGHRIHTLNLDFLHGGPLPERHPQNLHEISAGGSIHRTLSLKPMKDFGQIASHFAQLTKAPSISLKQTCLSLGESLDIVIYANEPLRLKIITPSGEECCYHLEPNQHGQCHQAFVGKEEGLYRILAEDICGKTSEAIITVVKAYSWYMEHAAKAALRHLPRATTHCESYYGFYTLYEYAKIDKDQRYLAPTEELMDTIYPLIFDDNMPTAIPKRIQNTAAMINILVNRYEATGELEHVHRAYRLATWLITHYQAEDGSYRGGKTHYTSVIYPAKNLMALMGVIKPLLKEDTYWQKAYDTLYNSVKAAIDELVAADGNIDTEGELTFEDGMISCSATQIALFARLQEDPNLREHYTASAKRYLSQHTCLTLLQVPDSRLRGGTLRFWEAQYDIGMQYNFMNSPHGWSSWRTYATYYMYLLTGEVDYLLQTMNAIGSGAQMIDADTGSLRWAFVLDPYIEVQQLTESCMPLDVATYVSGHYNTMKYPSASFTIGEQYLPMVSHWQGANMQDNDVHEHYKCMAEVVLTKAYVHQKADGLFVQWNCKVFDKDDVLMIMPNEDVVTWVCVYLETPVELCVGGKIVNGNQGFNWYTV